jgi:hypothetical protein
VIKFYMAYGAHCIPKRNKVTSEWNLTIESMLEKKIREQNTNFKYDTI